MPESSNRMYELAMHRVRSDPCLQPHQSAIMCDWREPGHWQWVATAPVKEIMDWAETIERDKGECGVGEMAKPSTGKSVRVPKKPRGKSFVAGNPSHFPRGVSGNPGGRPKVITEAPKRSLGTPINPDDPESPTGAEVVPQAMFIQTAKGNVSAARELREATETGTAPDGNMIFPRISQIIVESSYDRSHRQGPFGGQPLDPDHEVHEHEAEGK